MRSTLAFLVTAVMAIVPGCSHSGLERVVVSGRVTLNGQPVSNGEIRFRPIKGTQGPVSGSSIVDGAYTAEGLGGVPVGTYRVVIPEGLTAADDRLPRRLVRDPLGSGDGITAEELDRLVQDYYRLRGWSPEGRPPEAD